jgi:uroporphyrinogen decarboxylase
MTESGADVVSLGVRHDLSAARRQYPDLVFQGNVSDELMRTGTPAQVAEATRACLRAGGGARHIVNLSHGMARDSPVANFEAFVRTAKEGLRTG